MALLKRLFNRIVTLLRSNRAEHELDREVASHLALLEDDLVARGMTPEEARVAARRRLGGLDQTKERHRDARSFMWLEDLRRDIPYAVRGFLRTPGFTIAAVLTLALGIGATTAVFSVVNTVLLEPLPYKDGDRILQIIENIPSRASAPPIRRRGMTWTQFMDWRARSRTLQSMGGFLIPPITLMSTREGSVRLTGALISPDLFAMLGARTMLGRAFDAADTEENGNVVVLGSDMWRRYFNADPEIVGRTVALTTLDYTAGFLDGTPLTIVGVMSDEFDFPIPQTDFWAPILPGSAAATSRLGVAVIATLREGVTDDAASDEANVIGEAVKPMSISPAPSNPLPDGMRRFEIERLKDSRVAEVRPALRVLAFSVTVVLLIVCANIATLLLARGTARQREIAVRRALGASRGRVVKQLLTESALLAAMGGLAGIGLAIGGVALVKTFAHIEVQGIFRLAGAFSSANGSIFPWLHDIAVDRRLLGYATLTSFATAALCGLVPALRLSQINWSEGLSTRGDGGHGGSLRRDTRLRDLLVVGQLVLATMLLVSAGLLANSFVKLSRVDPGYEASRVLTFYHVMPSDYPTSRKEALIEALLAELRRIPGVEASAFTYAGPLLGVTDFVGVFVPEGKTAEEARDNPRPEVRSVSHDFFRAMGVRLVEGRWLDERDDAAAQPVIVVNRTMVRRLFGNKSPVGSLVHFDGRMDLPAQQIVGVVDDMLQDRIDREPAPQLFIDYRQMLALTRAREMPVARQESLAFGFLSFVVRTNNDPAALIPIVRTLVARVDPAAGIDAIAPMEQLVASSLTRPRFYALLIGIFAAIAALLGAIGIYGVLAYAVLQRTQEIGVRMALGAQRRQVLRLVLGRGVLLASIGIIVGIAAAAGLSRYLTGMLYGLTPLDPATYIIVATLFALVALIASYLPARRATKVDPMVALRCE